MNTFETRSVLACYLNAMALRHCYHVLLILWDTEYGSVFVLVTLST